MPSDLTPIKAGSWFFPFLFIFFLSPAYQAQSLEILDAPSKPVQGYYDDGKDLESEFYVKNTSSNDLEVGGFRRVVDTVQGSENRFCWSPTCWPPSVDTANAVQTISGNGGIDSTFKGYYTPDGNPGIAAIEYCFYDTSNVSDSVCTIVRYDASSSVSIEEKRAEENIRLKLSPNPARDRLNVELEESGKGTIRLHSILGEIVLERKIEAKKVELDVSKLDEGLHFLTFEGKSGGSVTQKVMIRN